MGITKELVSTCGKFSDVDDDDDDDGTDMLYDTTKKTSLTRYPRVSQ
jgi:hypothetical protein